MVADSVAGPVPSGHQTAASLAVHPLAGHKENGFGVVLGEHRQHACVNFLPRQTSPDICFRIIEGKCDFGLFGFCPC